MYLKPCWIEHELASRHLCYIPIKRVQMSLIPLQTLLIYPQFLLHYHIITYNAILINNLGVSSKIDPSIKKYLQSSYFFAREEVRCLRMCLAYFQVCFTIKISCFNITHALVSVLPWVFVEKVIRYYETTAEVATANNKQTLTSARASLVKLLPSFIKHINTKDKFLIFYLGLWRWQQDEIRRKMLIVQHFDNITYLNLDTHSNQIWIFRKRYRINSLCVKTLDLKAYSQRWRLINLQCV